MTRGGGPGRIPARMARKWVSGVMAAGFLLLGGCVPEAAPTSPATPDAGVTSPSVGMTTPTSAEPTVGEPSPGGVDWASFPPNHLDAARDLSDPQFPPKVSTFDLDDLSTGSVSTTASYVDTTNYRSIGVTVVFSLHEYPVVIDGLQDVAYHGRAVCGSSRRSGQTVCLMVGMDQMLEVRAGTGVPIEDAVSFTEEVYDLL